MHTTGSNQLLNMILHQSFTETTMRMAKDQRDRWSYGIVGPTILHLKTELYLWLAMTLFTVANLQGLYKDSFGILGDLIYVLCVAIWLSRHLIFRWLCLWDTSTSRNPTIRGFLSCFLTSHIYSGQTFDRPSHVAVSKFTASSGSQNKMLSLALCIPASLQYLIQLVKIRLYFPTVRLLNLDLYTPPSFLELLMPALNATAGIRTAMDALLQYTYATWASTSPSLSFLSSLAITAFFVIKLLLLCFSGANQSSSYANISARPHSSLTEENEVMKPYGMYQNFAAPQWSTVVFFISAFGTLSSLFYSFRIMLPMPDQVAGGNVIRDVRNEYRTSTAPGTNKSTRRRDNQDSTTSWNERHRPGMAGNRFQLMFSVRMMRMAEYVVLCGLLPRTVYICRATGHCPPGVELWQLTKVLYPSGITTPLRRDIGFSLDTVASDRTSAIFCIVGIILVSLSLQVAQSILLNKSYLALLAYVSDEWEVVPDADLSLALGVWDPRRRYKKGDLILHPTAGKHQRVYKAVASAPESKPMNTQLRLEHDLFAKELGHPATSSILRMASVFETTVAGAHFLMLLAARYLFGFKAMGLETATMAHALATYALTTLGTVDYNEISQLSAEISQVRSI